MAYHQILRRGYQRPVSPARTTLTTSGDPTSIGRYTTPSPQTLHEDAQAIARSRPRDIPQTTREQWAEEARLRNSEPTLDTGVNAFLQGRLNRTTSLSAARPRRT